MQVLYELAIGLLLLATGYVIGALHESARNTTERRDENALESVTEQLDDGTLTFGEDGAEMNVEENASIADVPPTTCWVCGRDDFETETDRNLHISMVHDEQERAFAMTTGKPMDPHDGFIGDE